MYARLAAILRGNLLLSTVLCVGGAILFALLRYRSGAGYHFGDLTAILAMLAGSFMMLHSEGPVAARA